ncbi:hypothetical protein THAOC_11418 [Thalassiosira oceanica]|uniref:Uncharacterized protein n=1 Tax=Thalassiosira oceanica TaxID=159749 RepID=K0T2L6_THAOC|nr:hypothetical protein THAOC_11418 [Thalassiosira oceanica]|eukprot:EJK67531.1 hypothetical protein THAOC_11418 [Thalassiosira oceanica]
MVGVLNSRETSQISDLTDEKWREAGADGAHTLTPPIKGFSVVIFRGGQRPGNKMIDMNNCKQNSMGLTFCPAIWARLMPCILLTVKRVNKWFPTGQHIFQADIKVAPAQMDGQGSRGEQLGKLRAEREAEAIVKLAGRDKSQWCNLHVM